MPAVLGWRRRDSHPSAGGPAADCRAGYLLGGRLEIVAPTGHLTPLEQPDRSAESRKIL
jgi:hypothetical protein